MKPPLTHYDILNVARDAPPDIIRAAYKALCRKFHPDLNNDGMDTTKIMATINVSYDVLSSPAKRRTYDRWLAEQESAPDRLPPVAPGWRKFSLPINSAVPGTHLMPAMPPMLQLPAQFAIVRSQVQDIAYHVWRHVGAYAAGSVAVAIAVASALSLREAPARLDLERFAAPARLAPARPADEGTTPYPQLTLAKVTVLSSSGSSSEHYTRADHAPNGYAWPTSAGYLSQVPVLHDDGQALLHVENASNSSAIHVKLVALQGLREYPVREFYLPAYGSFTLKNLSAGRYDLRYRDLDNGRLARSQEFVFDEDATDSTSTPAPVTVILDKIRLNEMQAFGMLEAEF